MAFERVGAEDRRTIRAVRDGGFVIGEERLEGGFSIWPDGLTPLDLKKVGDLSESDFDEIASIRPPRDVLLIGSGAQMAWPDFDLLTSLRKRGLGPEVMDSRAAARTYNLLLSEERAVAALILPL
ncbi:MAG: Mth938-like domain-containing protein [Pacificimonas sp.]